MTRLDGKVAEVRPLYDVVAELLEVALPSVQSGLVHRSLGGHEVVLDLLLHVELGLEDLRDVQCGWMNGYDEIYYSSREMLFCGPTFHELPTWVLRASHI